MGQIFATPEGSKGGDAKAAALIRRLVSTEHVTQQALYEQLIDFDIEPPLDSHGVSTLEHVALPLCLQLARNNQWTRNFNRLLRRVSELARQVATEAEHSGRDSEPSNKSEAVTARRRLKTGVFILRVVIRYFYATMQQRTVLAQLEPRPEGRAAAVGAIASAMRRAPDDADIADAHVGGEASPQPPPSPSEFQQPVSPAREQRFGHMQQSSPAAFDLGLASTFRQANTTSPSPSTGASPRRNAANGGQSDVQSGAQSGGPLRAPDASETLTLFARLLHVLVAVPVHATTAGLLCEVAGSLTMFLSAQLLLSKGQRHTNHVVEHLMRQPHACARLLHTSTVMLCGMTKADLDAEEENVLRELSSLLSMPFRAVSGFAFSSLGFANGPSPQRVHAEWLALQVRLRALVLTFFYYQPALPAGARANPVRRALAACHDDFTSNANVPAAAAVAAAVAKATMSISFNDLLAALLQRLDRTTDVLLLYTWALHNRAFGAGIAASQPQAATLALAILPQLYQLEEGHFERTDLLAVVLLVATSHHGFGEALARSAVPEVPWYKERALLNVCLLDLTMAILLRAFAFNLRHGRDQALHQHLLATLNNLASSVEILTGFASQSLVQVCHKLSRSFQRLQSIAQPQESRALAEHPVNSELRETAAALHALLGVVSTILVRRVRFNEELVYTLLADRASFDALKMHPRFAEELENIIAVLDFFDEALNVARGKASYLTEPDVRRVIQEGVARWADTRFSYGTMSVTYCFEERRDASDFFMTCTWRGVVDDAALVHADTHGYLLLTEDT